MARITVASIRAVLGYDVESEGAQRFAGSLKKLRAQTARPITQEVRVDDQKASSDIDRINRDLQRAKDRWERKGLVIDAGVKVDKLKGELGEAQKAVDEYNRRIATASTERTQQLRKEADARKAAATEQKRELDRTKADAVLAGSMARERKTQHNAAIAALREEGIAHDLNANSLLREVNTLKAKRDALAATDKAGRARYKKEIDEHAKRMAQLKQEASELKSQAAIINELNNLHSASDARRAAQLQREIAERRVLALETSKTAEAADKAAKKEENRFAASQRMLGVHRDIAAAKRDEARASVEAAEVELRNLRLEHVGKERSIELLRLEEAAQEKVQRAQERASRAARASAVAGGGGRRGLFGGGGRGGRGDGGGSDFGPVGDFFSRLNPDLSASFLGLRGALTTIAALATLLTPILVSLGTTVVALAASFTAAAAGAASLGTGLAATILPLGLLGAAIGSRLGLIQDAWTQVTQSEDAAKVGALGAGKIQVESADRVKTAQEGVKAAHDRVKTAQDGVKAANDRVTDSNQALADAQQGVLQAQEDLTDARFRARREVEDMRRAVVASALAEDRASLSLEDAINHLRELQDRPDTSRQELRDAQLAVREARASLADIQREQKRGKEDLARGTDTVKVAEEGVKEARRGVADATQNVARAHEGVAQAQEGVRAAQVGVAKATRDVGKAQQDAAQGVASVNTAANQAQVALSKLTDAERSVLTNFRKISKVFSEVMRPATDAVFESVSKAIATLTPLLRTFGDEFKGIGNEVGKVIEHAAKSLAGPDWKAALESFSDLTERIIGPLSNAFGSILETFRNLALASKPFVIDFAKNVEEFFGKWAKGTSDIKAVRDVMRDLLRHTKDWVDFFGQVGELLFNIFKGGKREGDDLLNTWTKVISNWNDFLESKKGQRDMLRFFHEARKVVADLGRFIGGFVTGIFEVGRGIFGLAKVLGNIAGAIVRLLAKLPGLSNLAASLDHLGEAGGRLKFLGEVLGGLAVLKFTGVIRLVSLLLKLAGTGGAIKGVFAAIGASKLFGGGGGGAGGGVLDIFASRGSTPAKPLFVFDVSGGGRPGPGGAPGGGRGGPAPVPVPPGGRVPGPLGRVGQVLGRAGSVLRTGARFAAPRALGAAGVYLSFITALNALTPNVDKLTHRLDALIEGPRDSPRAKRMRELAEQLDRAIKAGDSKKIRSVAGALDDLAKSAKQEFVGDKLKELADDARKVANQKDWPKLRQELKDTDRQYKVLAIGGNASMKDIEETSALRTRQIKEHLSKNSEAGRIALADNFEKARKAVIKQMGGAEKVTDKGMQTIRGFLEQELRLYGFTIRQARIAARGRGADGHLQVDTQSPVAGGGQRGMRFRQGGWLGGGRGAVGEDTIRVAPNAYAASGEFLAGGPGGHGAILNRHQIPYAEMALGGPIEMLPRDDRALPMLERAMGGAGGLDALFATVTRPHMMRGGGRLLGAVGAANQLERAHFPYHWGGGHEGSPAPFPPPHGGYDCSGAVSYVLQRAGVKIPTMVSGQFMTAGQRGPGRLTTFANQGHVLMRIGNRFFGTSGSNPDGGAGWIDPAPSSGYLSQFVVRHFDGLLGGANLIRTPKVIGGGTVGKVAGRALQLGAASARKLVDRAASRVFGGGDPGDSGVVSGSGAALMRQISARRGWNFSDWWKLDAAETSHGRNLVNPKSTARLRGQFLDMNWGAYGPGSDPRQNPSMVQQIRSMARYIASRYGNPTRAWAFHQANNYYGRGGPAGYQPGGRVVASTSTATGHHAPARVSDPYNIGVLRQRNRTRIAAYDEITQKVERWRTDYEYRDRKFGQSEETLINEKDGTVNMAAVRKRADELDRLIQLREKIAAALEKALVIARRVVNTYKNVIKRLKDARKHSKKKKRSGIDALIDHYRGEVVAWEDNRRQAFDNARFAQLDVVDLQNERAGILGTKPEDRTETGLTADQQALIDQAEQKGFIRGRTQFLDRTVNNIIDASGDPGQIGYARAPISRGDLARPTSAARAVAGEPITGIGREGSGMTVIQNINTLLPGDSRTYDAVGRAATIGQSMQGSVQTPRTILGV